MNDVATSEQMLVDEAFKPLIDALLGAVSSLEATNNCTSVLSQADGKLLAEFEYLADVVDSRLAEFQYAVWQAKKSQFVIAPSRHRGPPEAAADT